MVLGRDHEELIVAGLNVVSVRTMPKGKGNDPHKQLVTCLTGFPNNWSSVHDSRKSISKEKIEGSSEGISFNSRRTENIELYM